MLLELGPRYQKPPFGSIQVNWTHPLARGLSDVWLFNDGAGAPWNLIKPSHRFLLNGTVSWAPGPSSLAINFPLSTAAYLNVVEASDTDYTGDITLLWRGMIRSGGNFRHFLGKHAGAGGINNPFDYRTAGDAGAQRIVLVRAAGGSSNWTSSITASLGVLHTIIVTQVAGNANASFYVDGVQETIAATALTPAGSGADIRCGVRTDGAVVMDGKVEVALIAKRAWSAADVALFQSDPYALLLQPAYRWSFPSPVAAAAVATVSLGGRVTTETQCAACSVAV